MKKTYLVVSLILVIGMILGCQTLSVQEVGGPAGVYLSKTSTQGGGEIEFTMAINADGTGYIEGTTGKFEFSGAKIDGDNFGFNTTINTQNGEMELSFEGTVDVDNVSGTIETSMGPLTFTGQRM